MTTEEINKQAAAIDSRKKQGFINHLKAAGRTDDQVREIFPKYAAQDAVRTDKNIKLREALLGTK